MALVFRRSAEEPARCALEIAEALQKHPELPVRMGIHSGPVSEVTDVSGRANLAGAGINMAQRVMDCGDAGHILLSQHVADDLVQYRQWAPRLRDLGECEVKHGVRLHLVNLYAEPLGNAAVPEKLQQAKPKPAAGKPARRISVGWIAAVPLVAILVAGGAFYFIARLGTNAQSAHLTTAATRSNQNVEAYNALLQGNFYFERHTAEDVRKAIIYYEEAIRLDPRYALAYARLSLAANALGPSYGSI